MEIRLHFLTLFSMLRVSLRSISVRQITVLWNFSFFNSHTLNSSSIGCSHNMRTKTTNKGRSYVEIISGAAENPINNENAKFSEKGFVEIWRKPRRRERMCTTKTLSDMREDIDKLAKTLYRLRTNEKEQRKKSPQVAVSEENFVEEEELRLSSYVNGPVERLTFTVRTPDRRILIKQFTGITVSKFAFKKFYCNRYFLFILVKVQQMLL